ncbi:hypothetical protein L2703_13845 [Shewanella basaltis]|uniref:hypothetical protein n=1 Tax=Shewanella basaltis TaxID=472183 RepID=UPI00200CEA2D|nr:hypothetical protein [Shewanella basaltis]MCL1114670.1 hypothetical protein [Shewanella basaltis]
MNYEFYEYIWLLCFLFGGVLVVVRLVWHSQKNKQVKHNAREVGYTFSVDSGTYYVPPSKFRAASCGKCVNCMKISGYANCLHLSRPAGLRPPTVPPSKFRAASCGKCVNCMKISGYANCLHLSRPAGLRPPTVPPNPFRKKELLKSKEAAIESLRQAIQDCEEFSRVWVELNGQCKGHQQVTGVVVDDVGDIVIC